MIYYLIYLSSATILYTDDELNDILSVSRKNNEKREISGILLYHDGSILQVLEGDEEQVKEVYDIIAKDNRHNGLITMVSGYTTERNFPDWSMGFRKISKGEWSDLTGYIKLDTEIVLSRIKGDNSEINTIVDSYIRNVR